MAARVTILILLLWASITQQKCPMEIQEQLKICTVSAVTRSNWDGIISCAYDYKDACKHASETPSPFWSNVFSSSESPEPKAEIIDEYDITINGNWSFLRKIGTDGWSVKLSKALKNKTSACSPIVKCENDDKCLNIEDISTDIRSWCVGNATEVNGCFVPWIGGFNVGKTFLLNKLTGRRFNSSFGVNGETRGINFILPKDTKLIHMDNPGVLRSVDPNDLKDRYMTDRFIEQMMPDIGDRIVLVVDILTSDEQVLISRLMDRVAAFSTRERQKQLYVLHNFKKLFTNKVVDFHIDTDIVKAFNAQPDDGHNPTYWTHVSKGGFLVVHLVFAAEKSEAGLKWNDRSLEKLKQWLKFHCTPLRLNVLGHFIEKLSPLLRDYFPANSTQDRLGKYYMSKASYWDAVFIRNKVLNWVDSIYQSIWQIKDQNKNEAKIIDVGLDSGPNPFELRLNTSKGDEIAYFDAKIVLNTSRELEYCNFTNTKIADTPQCHPEPHCVLLVSKETLKIQCILGVSENEFTWNYNADDVASKFTAKIVEGSDPPELRIFGTILPPWKQYVNKDEDGEKLELQYSDRKLFGWFSKSFQIPYNAEYNIERNKTTLKKGIFTIEIPLNDANVKQEL
eukprot:96909_1